MCVIMSVILVIVVLLQVGCVCIFELVVVVVGCDDLQVYVWYLLLLFVMKYGGDLLLFIDFIGLVRMIYDVWLWDFDGLLELLFCCGSVLVQVYCFVWDFVFFLGVFICVQCNVVGYVWIVGCSVCDFEIFGLLFGSLVIVIKGGMCVLLCVLSVQEWNVIVVVFVLLQGEDLSVGFDGLLWMFEFVVDGE